MRWLPAYITICVIALVLVIAALVLLVSFANLGLSTNGAIALVVGGALTVALAMLLMGLIFLSSRRGHDERQR